MELEQLMHILHREHCSCVLWNHGRVNMFHQRGVKDLYDLLATRPELLQGAMLADKVVGKGAAALMALGGVKAVYADVISIPARRLLEQSDCRVCYGEEVENIINRAGTGICPVESLCMNCRTPQECLPLITSFIQNNTNRSL